MLRRESPAPVTTPASDRRSSRRLAWLLAGWALLAVAAAGAQEADSTTAGPDDDLLDEQLEEEFELLRMEEQVVTATRQKQTVAAAPAIIAVITREQIRRRGYSSVAEALADLPGIYVNYDYVFYDVGLRGISNELRGASRSIKVLINGQDVSFRSETSNFLGPELLPLEAVERIEVVRGPGSALYGANAFLGTVNIITRGGGQVDGGLVKLSTSLFGEAYGGVGLEALWGRRLGPVELLLALSQQWLERSGRRIRCTTAVGDEQPCDYPLDVTRALLDRQSFDDLARPGSFFASLTLDPGDWLADRPGAWGSLQLQGNMQLLDYRGSFSDWGSLNHDDIVDEQGRVTGHLAGSGNRVALGNLSLRAQYQLALLDDRLRLKVGVTHARGNPLDRERLEEVTGVVNRSRYGFASIEAAAELSWSLFTPGQQTTAGGWWLQQLVASAGLDFNNDRITYVPVGGSAAMSFASSTLRNFGPWAQLAATLLGGNLSLVAGARYDYHRGGAIVAEAWQRLSEQEIQRLCDQRVCYRMWSWRAGATYRLLEDAVSLGSDSGFLFDNLHLKLLYGTAFKAPSPLFLYQEDFLGERPLNPNPALLPQTVDSLELLLGSAHWRRRLECELTFFYNRLENRAEFTRDGMAVVASNGAPVRSWGIEFAARLRYQPLELRASLSYQHSRRDLGENLDRRITDTFGYPDLMARAGIDYRIAPLGLVASLDASYIGRRVGHPFNRADRQGERYTLAPYFLLDLGLATDGWKPWDDKETRLQLTVRNLLGARYDFPGFQPYYRYDVPGLPRIIMLSLSQEL